MANRNNNATKEPKSPEIQLLEKARLDLLDLTARNKLINMSLGSKSSKSIQVVEEDSQSIYKVLVENKKEMTFTTVKSNGTAEDEIDSFQYGKKQKNVSDSIKKKYEDSKLNTNLDDKILIKKLKTLFNDAKEVEEEQGINILYLSLGALKWKEKAQGNAERISPLVLIPVQLKRGDSKDSFTLSYLGTGIDSNLTLIEKIKADPGIELPRLNVNDEDVPDISKFFQEFEARIKKEPTWEISENTITLGLFSFAKLLMYKDLDDSSWPGSKPLSQNGNIKTLLGKAVVQEPTSSSGNIDWLEVKNLDEHLPVDKQDYIVEADASQTRVIEMVRQGKSLVVQGPPGTGKSQTITNLIATAVLDGKKVLFLAEKLAALEVVYKRLEKEGLADMCLNLSSAKMKKADIYDSFKKSWDLQPVNLTGVDYQLAEHQRLLSELNKHPEMIHNIPKYSDKSYFYHISILSLHGTLSTEESKISLPMFQKYDNKSRQKAISLLENIYLSYEAFGDVDNTPWRGITINNYSSLNVGNYNGLLEDLASAINKVINVFSDFNIGDNENNRLHSGQLKNLNLLLSTLIRNHSKGGINCHYGQLYQNIKTISKAVSLYGEYKVILQSGKFKDKREFVPVNDDFVASIQKGKSFWGRLFSGEYKNALAQLKINLNSSSDENKESRVKVANEMRHYSKLISTIKDYEETVVRIFDTELSFMDSLDYINGIVDVLLNAQSTSLPKAIFEFIMQMGQDIDFLISLQQSVSSLQGLIAALDSSFQIEQVLYKGLWSNSKGYDLANLQLLSTGLLENMSEIDSWMNYIRDFEEVRDFGLESVFVYSKAKKLSYENALILLEKIYSRLVLDSDEQISSYITKFSGAKQNLTIRDFVVADSGRHLTAKKRVLAAHDKLRPQRAPIGATGILLGEVNKKRNLMPLRKLIGTCGHILTDLKPVFMMSPLSVAQYLPPGEIEFDILIIDEASQVRPVEALGAIARCNQIVVVGDDKQLPPTNFFTMKTAADEDSDEDYHDTSLVGDMESILTLCMARGFKDVMLKWHYRSKHESLIRVSNQEYYGNSLLAPPSPFAEVDSMGVKFVPVNGVYDRGGSSTNLEEAKAVAQAVVEHAKSKINQSLLVATFSTAQQNLIRDLVEDLRYKNPDIESFFSESGHESFTVKNLENVQGDERDVIFISIGYGKDSNGKMNMNFGPLNLDGGHRRLNVLITRAKYKCTVFSSISYTDLDLTKSNALGVRGLKTYLKYAETQNLDSAEASGKTYGSYFEQAVATKIMNQLGLKVVPQVGSAGFYIDLAIPHPKREGEFVLGIECDGATYHSSPSARERDRMRQRVLEDKGWTIHRVWSVDYFKNPTKEINAIKEAYDQALTKVNKKSKPVGSNKRNSASTSVVPSAPITPSRIVETPADKTTFDFVSNYVVGSFSNQDTTDLYSKTDVYLSNLIMRIVDVEGPVHQEIIYHRIKETFGISNLSNKAKEHIDIGFKHLQKDNRIGTRLLFWFIKEKKTLIRERGDFPSKFKNADYIYDGEITLCIIEILRMAKFAERQDLIKFVLKTFGLIATSQNSSRVDDIIKTLLSKRSLVISDEQIRLSS